MGDCYGSSLAQLHNAQLGRDKKAIEFWTQDLEKKSQQKKIMWIRDKYPMTYDRTVEASKTKNRNIWFDPRYWSTSDIKEFFEDLQFVNQEVWELTHIKLSKNCNNRKAEKRYIRDTQKSL
jgi:hypothetical protein